jgi:tripartite-type tricarboxylate transporter receptor subunit TctC
MSFYRVRGAGSTPRKILAALSLSVAALSAVAQPYPSQPIRMIVGFSAGSATDVVGRVVAQELSKRLGQPVVVENKTGAGGSIAAETVVRSNPDGHTLLFVSSAIAVNPAVYPNLTFDVQKDLTPIALVGKVPVVVLVGDSVPAKSLSELVALAKKRPGDLDFGTSGIGGSIHMATELFAQTAGIKITHIPYRGNSQAIAGLLSGEVSILVDTVINAVPQLKSPRIRALGITGDTRSPLAPEVPTFRELGLPNFDAGVLFGVMGPANMPAAVLERLNTEMNHVLHNKDVQKRLSEGGGLVMGKGGAKEFKDILTHELATWKTVATEAKLTPQ